MKRRSLLACASVLVSGCVENVVSPASTPEAPRTRTVRVANHPADAVLVGTIPTTSPFSHELTVVERRADTDPLAVRVRLRNETDAAHVVETPNTPLPFPGRRAESRDGGILYLTLEKLEGSGRETCWTTGPVYLQPAFDSERVEPGGELHEEYFVVNGEENETCWPAGTYRFAHEYTVDPDSETPLSYEWWFAVVVG